jgi:uncharacterized protein (DUF1697 family)
MPEIFPPSGNLSSKNNDVIPAATIARAAETTRSWKHRRPIAMHSYISMLRGINVSGQKPVKMTALKTLYESVGVHDVATYIQSGNVVFKSSKNDASLVRTIEAAIEDTFGFGVSVVIRRSDEMEAVLRACPFIGRDTTNIGRLYVTFLSAVPSAACMAALHAVPLKTNDEFIVSGREVFLHCPDGYGNTQLSNTFFEKHLKLPATTRNWKTVNTLYAMAAGR